LIVTAESIDGSCMLELPHDFVLNSYVS